MRSKGMLNSMYGMSVTDIVRDENIYNGEWSTKKADVNAQLEKYNKKIEETVRGARNEMEGGQKKMSPEEWLLLAEYSLDFASQAADRALLISLEAIGKQAEEELS